MTGEPWLFAALAVLVLGHVLAAWLGLRLERQHGSPTTGDGPDSASRSDADGTETVAPGDREPGDRQPDAVVGDALDGEDLVTCRHCGAVNERGYGRCRNCVGALPGADARVSRSVPSQGDILP